MAAYPPDYPPAEEDHDPRADRLYYRPKLADLYLGGEPQSYASEPRVLLLTRW